MISDTDGRHSPHGECGLKCAVLHGRLDHAEGHSPHGECGLKYAGSAEAVCEAVVTPRMGSAG